MAYLNCTDTDNSISLGLLEFRAALSRVLLLNKTGVACTPTSPFSMPKVRESKNLRRYP